MATDRTRLPFFSALLGLPWLLVAGPFGFKAREFFSAEGDTAPPEVSFAA